MFLEEHSGPRRKSVSSQIIMSYINCDKLHFERKWTFLTGTILIFFAVHHSEKEMTPVVQRCVLLHS